MDKVAKAIYTGAKPICMGPILWPMLSIQKPSRRV